MSPAPDFTPPQLREALDAAGYQPGERFELCAKPQRRRTMIALWARYDAAGLEQAARWVARRNGRCSLYMLANPIREDVDRLQVARALNEHCAGRRLLLLDVDPVKVKPKHVERGDLGDAERTPVSAADLDPGGTRPAKLQAAGEIAEQLRDLLADKLGVRPALVSSGRGRQVWLRIAGDHDDDTRRRLSRGLDKLLRRPGLAEVDTGVHNVARLMRLPGTVNLGTGDLATILDPGDGLAAPADKVHGLALALDPPAPPREPSAFAWADLDPGEELAKLADALDHVLPDTYETWIAVGQGLAGSGLAGAYELWDRWSATGAGYKGSKETGWKWRTFGKRAGGRTLGTVYHLAQQGGWVPQRRDPPTRPVAMPAITIPGEPEQAQQEGPDGDDPIDDELALPLADVEEAPRDLTPEHGVEELQRVVLRGPARRLPGDAGPIVQDRRPTGAGKTTTAAREVVSAAAETGGRYAWAAPSHDLARLEVLPALAAAGAVIWDEDLDGKGEGTGVRDKLRLQRAVVVEVGRAGPTGAPTVCKVPPFACPGPAVPGWDAEAVAERYQEAAARGWNPATTVCRACPRFISPKDDRCPYWDRRRDASRADVVVIPHAAVKEDAGAAKGRRALVIDEDPSGALIKRHRATRGGVRAFRALLLAAVDVLGADAQLTREKLDALPGPAPAGQRPLWAGEDAEEDPGELDVDRDVAIGRLRASLAEQLARYEVADLLSTVARTALDGLDELVAGWEGARSQGKPVAVAHEFPCPPGVAVHRLDDPGELQGAAERVLRELGKDCGQLADDDGQPVGPARNLFPLLGALAEAWGTGRPAVVHTATEGAGLAAVVPVVEALPPIPILALDATGDRRVLELATGRHVRVIEGAMTARLEGLHLADAACSRRRWRADRNTRDRGGRTGAEALDHDVQVVVRHLRRVGARRVGLITFKAVVDRWRAELQGHGFDVQALHYGGERGSNAFQRWADVVLLAGTPFVHPAELRLRASIEGAKVAELLARPSWERRRLPGGGTVPVSVQPGPATQRAYAALVRAALEQALGRAMRGRWTPPAGVLVLAEPWPTRHRLTITTRSRAMLDGPGAELADMLREVADEHGAGHGAAGQVEAAAATNGPTSDVLALADLAIRGSARTGALEGVGHSLLAGLVEHRGGTGDVAEALGVSRRTVLRWTTDRLWPEPQHLAELLRPADDSPAPWENRTAVSETMSTEGQGGPQVDKLSGGGEGGGPSGGVPVAGVASVPLNDVYRGDRRDTTPLVHVLKGSCPFGPPVENLYRWPEPPTKVAHDLAMGLVARAARASGGVKPLARSLGVSPKAVRKWIRGDSLPQAERLKPLWLLVYRWAEADEPLPGEGKRYAGRWVLLVPDDDAADVAKVGEASAASGAQAHSEPAHGPSGGARVSRDPGIQPRASEAAMRADSVGADFDDAEALAELRSWVSADRHPLWLLRAVRLAESASGLSRSICETRAGGVVKLDRSLGLQRLESLDPGEASGQVRQLLGRVAGLLRSGRAPTSAESPNAHLEPL